MGDENLQQIPDDVYQELLRLQQLQQEYSVSKGWQPIDQGTQKGGLNYQQDLMGQLQDPFQAFMMGPGSYDPTSLFGDVVEETPGNAEGERKLRAVIDKSPGTPQAFIAASILDGQTGDQAYNAAVAAGLIDEEKMSNRLASTPGDRDMSAVEALRSFADTSWSDYIADTPTTQTSRPNDFVKSFIDSGLGDPRQQYDPQYMAALGGVDLQGMEDRVAGLKSVAQARSKGRDEMSAQVAAQRKAIEQLRASGGGGQGPQLPPQSSPASGVPGMGGGVGAPSVGPQQAQRDLASTLFGMSDFNEQGASRAHPRGGGGGPQARSTAMPRGAARDLMRERGVAQGPRAYDSSDVRLPSSPERNAYRAFTTPESAGSAANKANIKWSADGNAAFLERIKAEAASRVLVAQGRSPAMDNLRERAQQMALRGF